MNEKGWCSALGGSFAVVRTAAAVPQAENFTSVSPLSLPRIRWAPFPFVFYLTFSLARISATAVSKLFLCLAVKGRHVERCVYIRACVQRESAVSCEGAFLRPALNYATSRISLIASALLPWIITNRDPLRAFVRRGVIFFQSPVPLSAPGQLIYSKVTECSNSRRHVIDYSVMNMFNF